MTLVRESHLASPLLMSPTVKRRHFQLPLAGMQTLPLIAILDKE